MQQFVVIPSPSGADTETVVTALETAAVFRAKGDAREAMRWLRRAAESAGEVGDDERALSLSRTAADLQDELSSEQDAAAAPQLLLQAAPPAPPPAPLPPSARAAEVPDSHPRLSSPPSPSTRSVAPSSILRASQAPRASELPRASQAPRPSSRPSPRPSYVGAARAVLSVVPPIAASVSTSRVVAAVPALAEPAALETTPAVSAEPPAPSTSETAMGGQPVAAATSPVSPPIPLPAPPSTSAQPALFGTGARHAARVAVTISTSKAGVFEVRLLPEGEAPRMGSSEALLVMLDPTSTLLAR